MQLLRDNLTLWTSDMQASHWQQTESGDLGGASILGGSTLVPSAVTQRRSWQAGATSCQQHCPAQSHGCQGSWMKGWDKELWCHKIVLLAKRQRYPTLHGQQGVVAGFFGCLRCKGTAELGLNPEGLSCGFCVPQHASAARLCCHIFAAPATLRRHEKLMPGSAAGLITRLAAASYVPIIDSSQACAKVLGALSSQR